MNISGLTFLRDSTWNEVFETWKKQEGSQASWQRLAVEKGWPDWESWRAHSAELAGLPLLSWRIYRIDDPNSFLPGMIIGPYKGWREQFQDSELFTRRTFSDLVVVAGEWCLKHPGIQRMMNDFPETSQMIGLFLREEDKVVCFEGTHRASAIALAVSLHKPHQFKSFPTIAIGELSSDDIKRLETLLKKGTKKS